MAKVGDPTRPKSSYVMSIKFNTLTPEMMFTLGCLSVLFGVLAMLWADGRLARGLLQSLF